MKNNTHIMTGNNLFSESSNSKKKFTNFEELKEALSYKYKDTNSEDISEKEIRAEKKAKQRSQIQNNDWQEVKSSSVSRELLNGKQICRSGDGSGSSDQNYKLTENASIFNPNPFSTAKNDEYTDHVIQSGKNRRKQRQEKMSSNRGELSSEDYKAKTTKDVPASMMGFVPHRTSLTQPELTRPSEEPKEISAQKTKISESVKAAEQIAKIYSEKENQKHNEMLRAANSDKNWQDHKADTIERNFNKEISSNSKPFNFGNPSEYRETSYPVDLSQIFATSKDNSEKKIKKDTSSIQDQNRQSRDDDRSWESVENSKQRNF